MGSSVASPRFHGTLNLAWLQSIPHPRVFPGTTYGTLNYVNCFRSLNPYRSLPEKQEKYFSNRVRGMKTNITKEDTCFHFCFTFLSVLNLSVMVFLCVFHVKSTYYCDRLTKIHVHRYYKYVLQVHVFQIYFFEVQVSIRFSFTFVLILFYFRSILSNLYSYLHFHNIQILV